MWTVRWNVGNSSGSSSWRRLSITCSWPRMQSKWHTITNRIPAAANEEPGRISTTPLDAAPGGPTRGSAVNCGSDCDTNSDGCFYFLFAQSDAGILHYLGPSSTRSSNVWCVRLSVPRSSVFNEHEQTSCHSGLKIGIRIFLHHWKVVPIVFHHLKV